MGLRRRIFSEKVTQLHISSEAAKMKYYVQLKSKVSKAFIFCRESTEGCGKIAIASMQDYVPQCSSAKYFNRLY